MRVIYERQDDGGLLTVDFNTYVGSAPDWFVTRTTENRYYYAKGVSMELAFKNLAREMSKDGR